MPRYNQIATALNNVISELSIGATTVDGVTVVPQVAEDLSNLSDVGRPILDYPGASNTNYETVVRKLIDQVGLIDLESRPYTSQAPDIMVEGWEYGAIKMKVRCMPPKAANNDTYTLADHALAGTHPDPFEIVLPDLSAKFYNNEDTYEVPITITEKQFESAVQNAGELQRLVSMILNAVDVGRTIYNDGLIEDNLQKLIAGKIAAGKNVVDLLALYNAKSGQSLTAEAAMLDASFLRFATATMAKYKKYLAKASTKYNDGGYWCYTPEADLKFMVIADFAKDIEANLYGSTYHEEFVKMTGYQELSCWMSTGDDADRTRIYTYLGYDEDGTKLSTPLLVDASGVVAVMFDRKACVVANVDDRVRSMPNPRGEYVDYFYKWDAKYMVDYYENCVVFVLGGTNDAQIRGTVAAGSASGSTKFTLTGSLPSGHSLKYNKDAASIEVTAGITYAASGDDKYPDGTWSNYTSGSNIASATAGKVLKVIELDADSKIVAVFEHKLVAADIAT